MLDSGDIFGDGVNVAARLEALSPPGGICISGSVYEQLDGKVELEFEDLGPQSLKNIARPVRVWQWHPGKSQHLQNKAAPAGSAGQDSEPGEMHHFPGRMTDLIGRERLVQEISDLILLEEARLVTLTGPGGSGKTRLSERVAANIAGSFPDGLWFVDLAPITDPTLVASTIAEKLGVQETTNRPVLESLNDFLKAKRAILVLDNFEQILPAANIVMDLLAACPSVCVLVTSRALLRLAGEYEVPVPPLSLPSLSTVPGEAIESEAVQLFEERARAARPGLELSAEANRAIAEICVRLDGLPLAIELAAARVRMLTPQEILSRLDRRLPTLTGGSRDLPTRQRTLQNTIAWSYDLLEPDEQQFFVSLAVFVGGFSTDAAEMVIGEFSDADPFDCLESLLEKSLIQRQSVADSTRFYLLQTVREFALDKFEKVANSGDIRRSHAQHYLNLAETCDADLRTDRQVDAIAELTLELDNIRGALTWTLKNGADAELGARLAGAPWWFWQVHGHFKGGREWAEEAMKNLTALSPRAQAGVLRSLSNLAFVQGDYDLACARAPDSRALFEQLEMPLDALWLYGLEAIATQYMGDVPRGRAMLEDMLASARAGLAGCVDFPQLGADCS